VQEAKKNSRWTVLKGIGQTQFSTKVAAKLSFMPQKN